MKRTITTTIVLFFISIECIATLVSSDEIGNSNGSYCLAPSRIHCLVLSDSLDLMLELKKGWNWVSSSLSESDNQNVIEFLNPIGDVTERFVSQTQEIIKDPVGGLIGNLTTIVPTDGYKLKVADDASHTWSGNSSIAEKTPVMLNKGWNWIGYVPVLATSLDIALGAITPSENDVVKGMDDFATYTGGEWVGTLTQMKPGEGYMYYAKQAVTFCFPTLHVLPVTEEAMTKAEAPFSSPWSYDVHLYPDNTTLVGQLYANDRSALVGTYTVGAFCGGECRGVGKYVGDRIFMTIHGCIADGETISFKAYDNVTEKEYDIIENLSFNGQQEGSYEEPLSLHIAYETTQIERAKALPYTVYPRPLRNRLFINGDTGNIRGVQVLSLGGAVIISQNGYPNAGIDVSRLQAGVYVVAIISGDGHVSYERVIVQ